MRLFLVFCILSSVLFCQYSEPPVSNVTQYNLDIADSLDGYYNSQLAQNSTITLFGQVIPLSASVDIAGLSLMVDNATHPSDDLSVIVARGTEQGHLTSFGGDPEFYCNAAWFNVMTSASSWRCDFDDDDCAEYERAAYVVYDISATFTFADVSETVQMESNTVEIPSAVLDAMRSASGADSLNVSLDGNVTFIYEINDRDYAYGDCGSNIYNRSASVTISTNRSFTVCGDNKIFFQVAPALGEQWFRNNRFDVAVLSQSPLYAASVYEDGNATRNMSIRNFSIISNSYGIEEIISNRTAADGWTENSSFVVTPIPLESVNNSFAYVYLFNHAYEGLGEHNLSLLVKDSFGGMARYDTSLRSVMLSYNGATTETGEPIGSQPSRKSAPSSNEYLARLDISLGLVALLLVLAFVNSWLLR
ncbi:hypothetical protein H0O00_01820 [Candidatus Micrarchaeota archaeon]|nr:hypothetical protein [Candidatus Micrarchaeota archaeon]